MSKKTKSRLLYGSFVAAFVLGIMLATIIPAIIHGYGNNDVSAAGEDKDPQYVIKERTVITELKYSSSTVEDGTLEYGTTAVKTKGVNGEKTYTYKDTYEGAKIISTELIREEITKSPINEIIARGTKVLWRCVDVTSFDRNKYNDNKCTSSTGEVRYLCDQEAERLDPNYRAGKRGAARYNNC